MENELDRLQKNDKWLRFFESRRKIHGVPTEWDGCRAHRARLQQKAGRCDSWPGTAVDNCGYNGHGMAGCDPEKILRRAQNDREEMMWQVTGGERFSTNRKVPVPLTRVVVSHIVALT